MGDKAWKQFERLAAALFGGKRHWANAGERVDFESDTAIGQCKLVKRMSMAEASELAEEMEREALPKGKIGVLCVKIRRGSGRKSPMLVVMTAAVYESMNGKRAEQIQAFDYNTKSATVGVPILHPNPIGVVPPGGFGDFRPNVARNEDPGYMAGPVLPNP